MGLSRQMCSSPFSNKQLKCIWGRFPWELSSRMIDCLCLLLRSNWKAFLCLAGSSHQVKSRMIFCAPYLFALRSYLFHKRQRAGTWKGSPQRSGGEQCPPVFFQPLSAMDSLNQGAFCWLWESTVWGQDQVCSEWEEPFRLPQHLAANELGGWFISRAAQCLELVLWPTSPHFLLSPLHLPPFLKAECTVWAVFLLVICLYFWKLTDQQSFKETVNAWGYICSYIRFLNRAK